MSIRSDSGAGNAWKRRPSRVPNELRNDSMTRRKRAVGYAVGYARTRRSVSPHPCDPAGAGRSRPSFYTQIETDLLRLERRSVEEFSGGLTGPRRQLKSLLRAVGNENSLHPTINDDGEGGALASWLVKRSRLEIGVDGDGDAYAIAVSRDGTRILSREFPQGSFDQKTSQTLRSVVRQLGQLRDSRAQGRA